VVTHTRLESQVPDDTARHLRQLAALLAYPGFDALAAVRGLRAVAGWPSAAALDELIALPLERWQAEHTRLFVNGYPSTPCFPFVADERGSAAALQDLYCRAGLFAAPELAGYLGTLLECAAYLLDARTLPEPPDPAVLVTLRDDYLTAWLPRFGAALQTHAALTLYRELGAALTAVPDRLR